MSAHPRASGDDLMSPNDMPQCVACRASLRRAVGQQHNGASSTENRVGNKHILSYWHERRAAVNMRADSVIASIPRRVDCLCRNDNRMSIAVDLEEISHQVQ